MVNSLPRRAGIYGANHCRALHCGVVEPLVANSDHGFGPNNPAPRRALLFKDIVPLADRLREWGGEILCVRVGRERGLRMLELLEIGEEAE
jgi:hypothetical protein